MAPNRDLSDKKIQKKLKKKKNKKKHKISSACKIQQQGSRSIVQSSQVSQLLLDSQAKPCNKIQKLIQDIVDKPTREKIVLLFIEAAQKSASCFDFEIAFWLNEYNTFEEEINFTEAALLIINAASIYARKVDFFNQFVRSCITQNESDDTAAENNQTRPQAVTKPRKQAARRPLSLHDRLYEAEMVTKQFKTIPTSRTTEILSTMGSFEAPTYYFRKWKEYKAWRLNHKKKMKSPVPYSIVCDDSYLHPAMWRQSCIEDFDYDDDIDTKRSYRMFTYYTEHRYGTLLPDINFIMHFKVKDYIEAEQDEIEIMKILGLQPPPTRQWPPFCKTWYSHEYVKATFNIDVTENEGDYVKNYVALEDIVLENGVYEIDNALFQSATEARKNGRIADDVIITHADRVVDAVMDQIVPQINKTLESERGKSPLPIEQPIQEQNENNLKQPIQEQNENNLNAANTAPVDLIHYDSGIQVSEPYTLNSSNDLNLTTDSVDITPEFNSDTIVTQQESGTKPVAKNALQIISESIQNNISDQIVIRISVDEGVAFSDLDDLDRAMLSPVVELVDILTPIKEEIIEPLSIIVDKTMQNLFAIDENYLNYEEHFRLPLEVLYNQPPIVWNILKLPESKLKRKVIFSLPTDYDAFKSCRLKRKRVEKPIPKRRTIEIFKLNDPNVSDVPMTPPGTPNREQDFYGFDENDVEFERFASGEIFSSTLNETLLNSSEKNVISPNRTISRDSGIGLQSSNDMQVSNMDITDSQVEFSEADLTINVSVPMDENNTVKTESMNSPLPDMNSNKQASCIGEENAIELLTKRIADSEKTQSSEESMQNKSELIQKRIYEMNEMMERIQKWHRHLKPILAKSKERHHFDIFGIGTEIIDTFAKDDSTITLDDVMVKNDPSFLSRYFLSTLQLANSNNVQIKVNNVSTELPIPLCDVELKLLSRQRHSISMEDDIGAHSSSSSRKRRHSVIAVDDESSPRNPTKSTENRTDDRGASSLNLCQSINDGASTSKRIAVAKNKSPYDSGASSSNLCKSINNGASTSKRISVPNLNHRGSTSKRISENTDTAASNSNVSLRNLFNDQGSSDSSQLSYQNQEVTITNRIHIINNEPTINRDMLLPNCNQSSSSSHENSVCVNKEVSSKNDVRISTNPSNLFDVPVSKNQSTRKYSETIVNAKHHIFNNSENNSCEVPIPYSSVSEDSQLSESNCNRNRDCEKILQKYTESNREILSEEVNAHSQDYIRLLTEKHDIDLYLYLTPDNNVTRKEKQPENNSFARECLIYPTPVRNQSINEMKRSQSHNDDLDSGIFSEFSSIDNNSFVS